MSIIQDLFKQYNEGLSQEERDKLPDSDFGIPSTRSYPMHDREHVIYAIRMFRLCSDENKKLLAKNIKAKAQQFDVEIPSDSEILNYL